MKIYVAVDMEGISGISSADFASPDGMNFGLGRKYYTWDMNACIEGCFQAGADGVIVRDNHGSSNFALLAELDPRAELVQGGTPKRFPGIEECDALILIGYHAMAGTPDALMEHTFSSASIQNMWLNGKKVGEIGIDAGIAADYGIPTIMVSGDDKCCREVEEWLPGAVTCQVKQGLACHAARLLSLEKAHALITAKTAEAVGKLSSINPLHLERPVTLRKELVERKLLPNYYLRPGVTQIDGRTLEATAQKVEEAFYMI